MGLSDFEQRVPNLSTDAFYGKVDVPENELLPLIPSRIIDCVLVRKWSKGTIDGYPALVYMISSEYKRDPYDRSLCIIQVDEESKKLVGILRSTWWESDIYGRDAKYEGVYELGSHSARLVTNDWCSEQAISQKYLPQSFIPDRELVNEPERQHFHEDPGNCADVAVEESLVT